MERISINDASREFSSLLEHVVADKVTVGLHQDNELVAILAPVLRSIQSDQLTAFFRSLPALNDDATSFADDLESVRASQTTEDDPWG